MLKWALMLMSSLLIFSATSWAVEFSADTVVNHQGQTTTGKMYSKGDRFRMDVKGPQETIAISRKDKKVLWNLVPQSKTYVEIPIRVDDGAKSGQKIAGETERKLLGSEVIDGHQTEKYLVTSGTGGKKRQMYQWWAADLDLAIKTTAVDGSWSQEFKNIKVGPQPDSLFELPKDYKKAERPGMKKPAPK